MLAVLIWSESTFLQPPWHAAQQGRLYKPVRVLLRYTAGTGLINQHYSHISAIALAATLGAELVLPPGVRPLLCCTSRLSVSKAISAHSFMLHKR